MFTSLMSDTTNYISFLVYEYTNDRNVVESDIKDKTHKKITLSESDVSWSTILLDLE
jgi:hypothetical protein